MMRGGAGGGEFVALGEGGVRSSVGGVSGDIIGAAGARE